MGTQIYFPEIAMKSLFFCVMLLTIAAHTQTVTANANTQTTSKNPQNSQNLGNAQKAEKKPENPQNPQKEENEEKEEKEEKVDLSGSCPAAYHFKFLTVLKKPIEYDGV